MGSALQFLVFILDDRRYALPLSQVDRVIRAVDSTPLPHAPPIVLGAVDLHGTLLPLLSVRARLRIASRPVGVNDCFIIARTSRRTVALVVDSVENIVAYPASSIVAPEAVVAGWEQIDGLMRTEDGLILIYNLDRFLSLHEGEAMEKALEAQVLHGN
jgi:purine-binding chemotaxis protein CheW